MATPPDFSAGAILTAAQMNAVGLWRNTSCGVTSVGGTAATASNGVITVGTTNTSVTVTSAFSADFTSYRVCFEGIDFSNNATQVRLTFGAAAAAYYSTCRFDNYDGLSTGFGRINNGANLVIAYSATGDDWGCEMTVINPNATKRTLVISQYTSTDYSGWANGQLRDTTAYTAFTLAPAAGSMTGGTIRVYGYRN